MRDVDRAFDLLYRVSPAAGERFVDWCYWGLPQRSERSRCAVIRRLLELSAHARGDQITQQYSDDDIVAGAIALNIPI